MRQLWHIVFLSFDIYAKHVLLFFSMRYQALMLRQLLEMGSFSAPSEALQTEHCMCEMAAQLPSLAVYARQHAQQASNQGLAVNQYILSLRTILDRLRVDLSLPQPVEAESSPSPTLLPAAPVDITATPTLVPAPRAASIEDPAADFVEVGIGVGVAPATAPPTPLDVDVGVVKVCDAPMPDVVRQVSP